MPSADSSTCIELIAVESRQAGLFGHGPAIHIVGTGNGWMPGVGPRTLP